MPKALDFQQTYTPFVKIANANWCLPYLSRKFNAYTIQLVRHPVAIALSQMNHWNMPIHLDKTLCRLSEKGHINTDQYHCLAKILVSSDEFIIRLAQSCIEIDFCLRRFPNAGVPVVKYETLRGGTLDDMNFLMNIDERWKEKFQKNFFMASKTTQSTSSLGKSESFDEKHIRAYEDLTDNLGLSRLRNYYESDL